MLMKAIIGSPVETRTYKNTNI